MSEKLLITYITSLVSLTRDSIYDYAVNICLLINEPGDAGNFDVGESRLATSRTPLRVSSAACLVDITLAVTTETLPLLVGV
jgi:hypothetical protein